jgi:hypothetical protein
MREFNIDGVKFYEMFFEVGSTIFVIHFRDDAVFGIGIKNYLELGDKGEGILFEL